MVNSSLENHRRASLCSEPESHNVRSQAGNQEQYLIFHTMTVQLKESDAAVVKQERICCA